MVRRYKNKMKAVDYIAIILGLIGMLNWGLVGFANFDLVARLLGPMSLVTRIIYAIVGIAGVYTLIRLFTRYIRIKR